MTKEAGSWIHDVHYNPVTVGEAFGTLFLGIVALILLLGLLRAQARNRRLLVELAVAHQEAEGT